MNSEMNKQQQATPAPHHHTVGRKLLSVVSMLLIFSLGIVVGMTSNSNTSVFPRMYLPSFVPPWPPSPPPQLPGLASFVAAPGAVAHNMTDEELFWRASMAPQVLSTPYHRVPKVAFMFMTAGELPLRPLWEKFFAGQDPRLYSIYVHTSPSYNSSPPADSVFYGRMIPSQATSWGDITLVDAERRLLANALLDLGNERFALLSDSAIPLHAFPTVYAYLTGSNASFVDSFVNHDSEVRYNPFFQQCCNITLAQWRKGFEWFEMERALAVAVVADTAYYPAFRQYCARRRYCLMDEHYIPTLLNVTGWRRNAGRIVTYEDWRRQGSHPRINYGRDVTEALLREIRAGAGKNCTYNGKPAAICYLFARKFAPDTLQPLLALAPKILGFG
ncbi:hypothetical protein ACP4OV_003817 [Aristida adscensionis]